MLSQKNLVMDPISIYSIVFFLVSSQLGSLRQTRSGPAITDRFRSVRLIMNLIMKSLLLPLPIHKMLLYSYEESIKQISSGSTNHNNVFGDFCRPSIKT